MVSNLSIGTFQICRTCMKEIPSVSSFFYLDYSPAHTHLTIRQKLNNCIPVLDLSIVSDAVICSKCEDAITSFYKFKQECLESETQIKKYIQQVQHTGNVNLVEVLQFHQPHDKNLGTKLKIKDFDVMKDIKNEDLVCDIDAFNEVDECIESNEHAYLHEQHSENLDVKVKMEDADTTKDFKIEFIVCDTNALNEANESKESMEPTYPLRLEKVDMQCVPFNTNDEYSAINNSNIAQGSFSQNLSKRDICYRCNRCGHKLTSKLKLILHLKRHTSIHIYRKDIIFKKSPKNYKNIFSSYRCSLCNYLTKYKCLFNFHNRIHLTKKDYRHTFQQKNMQNHCYNQHNFKHRSKHIQSTKHFSHHNSLKRNTEANVVEKPFKCSFCEYQCNKKGNLNRHILIHTGEKPFSCSICEFQCIRKEHLKEHIRIHTGEKPFACSVCEYQCTRKEHLKQHMRIHTGEKPFSCTVCEYQCSRKTDLKRHILIHTGKKLFSCSVCKYQCNQQPDLKRHFLVHTGEKPFSCFVCEYKCGQKSQLKQHIRIHTKEKPFTCSVCEYQCNLNSNLKRHMQTHTQEKPFSCTYCEFKCSRKGGLKRHMKIHAVENL